MFIAPLFAPRPQQKKNCLKFDSQSHAEGKLFYFGYMQYLLYGGQHSYMEICQIYGQFFVLSGARRRRHDDVSLAR